MSKCHIIQADARAIPLPDNSVQCVCTSPPYWGLRDYGLTPEVWGGDRQCQHEWGEWREKRDVREAVASGKTRTTDRCYGAASRKFDGNHQKHTAGSFCVRCGAWLGCLGLEPTPELFGAHLVEVFREVRRVLRPDGVAFLNLGDSYASNWPCNRRNVVGTGSLPNGKREARPPRMGAGLKDKDLIGIPWLVAFALRADGWWLRDCIIWNKPNPMPSSVTDRTTTAHEYIFLLTKAARYFYDADAIREPITSTGGASFGKQNHDAAGTGQQSRRLASPEERNNPLGRNKRSVWKVSTQSYHGAHFATWPTRLVEPMIRAGTSEKGCCPTCGAPWKRVVEKIPNPSKWANLGDDLTGGAPAMGGNRQTSKGLHRNGTNVAAPRWTSHWLPTCKCPAHAPVPCLVLDPFGGSGTTGQVAVALGRNAVVIDRKAEYLELARERVNIPPRLHGEKPVKRPRRVPNELDLFSVPAARGVGGAA